MIRSNTACDRQAEVTWPDNTAGGKRTANNPDTGLLCVGRVALLSPAAWRARGFRVLSFDEEQNWEVQMMRLPRCASEQVKGERMARRRGENTLKRPLDRISFPFRKVKQPGKEDECGECSKKIQRLGTGSIYERDRRRFARRQILSM
ncbi:hypothetical protein ERJ75_000517700 [Trypanosoma vivax]|nr:hypothetical protein ERJ75_000517700 [Trypanosoma vivax]